MSMESMRRRCKTKGALVETDCRLLSMHGCCLADHCRPALQVFLLVRHSGGCGRFFQGCATRCTVMKFACNDDDVW